MTHIRISSLTLSPERQRQARFTVVTVLAYLTYVAVYRLFVTFIQPSHHRTLMYVLAIMAGDIVNYLGNRYWVFRAEQEQIQTQGTRFMLVMLFSLLLQTVLFNVGRSLQFLSETVLLLSLPGFRACVNYVCHRVFTFRQSSSL